MVTSDGVRQGDYARSPLAAPVRNVNRSGRRRKKRQRVGPGAPRCASQVPTHQLPPLLDPTPPKRSSPRVVRSPRKRAEAANVTLLPHLVLESPRSRGGDASEPATSRRPSRLTSKSPELSPRRTPSARSIETSSAWMIAHQVGVAAVFRGSFELKFEAAQEEATRRAVQFRDFERRAGEDERARARRWKQEVKKERSRRLAEEEELRRSAQAEALRTEAAAAEEVLRAVAEEESAAARLDEETAHKNSAAKAQRLANLTKHRQKETRAKLRQTVFDLAVTTEERLSLETAFAEAISVKTGGSAWDGVVSSRDIPLGLAGLGIGHRNSKERDVVLEVIEFCEAELGLYQTDVHTIGVQVLPRVRAALRELTRPQALAHFNLHCNAFGREIESTINGTDDDDALGALPTLTEAECIATVDRFLGESEEAELCDHTEDVQWLIQALQQRVRAHREPALSNNEEFVALAQFAVEKSAWLIRQQAHRVAAGRQSNCEEKSEREMLTLDGLFHRAEANGGLDADSLFTQLGLAPLRAGTSDFGPMEHFLWDGCKEVFEHLPEGDRVHISWAGSLAAISGVRQYARRRASQWLLAQLRGKGAADTGEPIASAGQALSLLQVVPQTVQEREAVDQELSFELDALSASEQSHALVSGSLLPLAALANLAARALERLLRDRREGERILVTALRLDSSLEKLRVAFVDEALTRAGGNAKSGAVGSSHVSGDVRLPTRTPAALGDGRKIAAKGGLRRVLLQLGCGVTEQRSLEFAVILAGLPPGSSCPQEERVDFAGVSTALRLALDAQKHFHGMSAQLGVQISTADQYAENGPPENGLKTEQGLRAVLSVLGLGGPLVCGLTRQQQEALVRRAVDASGHAFGTEEAAASEWNRPLDRLALPELLRRAFATRLVRGH